MSSDKRLVKVPNVPASFVESTKGLADEVFMVGPIKVRVLEDGSNTLPPKTRGPVAHWHEMYDETFFVLAGTLRFHLRDGKTLDCAAGDYIAVPICCPHTFSNPFDKEAIFFGTFTPCYHINYLRLMGQLQKEGKRMDPAVNMQAMAYTATIAVPEGL